MELAIQYAAPYSTTLLADLGARVIKIEPLDGDPIRRQIPQFPELGGGKVMQGKESLALNLQTPEGVEIVQRLAGRVDAVVEGFREGAAARRSVDAASLRAINPRLVYLNARGYGVAGPFADRASFAPSFGAAGGIAAAHLGGTGTEDGTLSIDEVAARSTILRSASATKYSSADGIGALCATTSILLGLVAQSRGVGGQQVVSSMLLSTAHAMASNVVSYSGSPAPASPGKEMRGTNPLYRIYDAADGWIMLAAPLTSEWPSLVMTLRPYVDLASDERFSSSQAREINSAVLADLLGSVFVRRTKHHWQDEFIRADIACVALHTGAPEAVLMSDEYGRASGYLADVTHPIFDEHPRLAPIVSFSRSAVTPKGGGLCGAETNKILTELGYSSTEIAELHDRGVVA